MILFDVFEGASLIYKHTHNQFNHSDKVIFLEMEMFCHKEASKTAQSMKNCRMMTILQMQMFRVGDMFIAIETHYISNYCSV